MEKMSSLRPGTILKNGNYTIEGVLGNGGFGITYRAIQSGLERVVAIKEFFLDDYCERSGSTSQVVYGVTSATSIATRLKEKFLKEAQLVSQLKCRNIVEIYDVFEENNTAYYVMEYIPGMNLSDYIKQNGPMTEQQALPVIAQVANALEYIHNRKILHLDVKPANIMFRDNNEVVLIDFGISKRYDDKGTQTSSAILGRSRGYAPIEQYKTTALEHFSPATDIYSLGATLYYLLTGMTPPESDEVLNDGIPQIVGVKPVVYNAIVASMQPTVKSRPQSIAEFMSLFKKGYGAVTPKVNSGSAFKQIMKWLAVTLVVAAISVGAYFALPMLFGNMTDAERGKELYEDKKYEDAIRYLKVAVQEEEDAECAYLLGKCYFYGNGVDTDLAEAHKYFLESAKANNPEAQYVVYTLYYEGLGVEADTTKAIRWLERAANSGIDDAMIELGDYYTEISEYSDAFEWYTMADSAGIPLAKYKLGLCYYYGYYVEMNNYLAIDLFREASRLGVGEGAYMVGECYYYGFGVDENEPTAVTWYKKAADLGYNIAMRDLGFCYANGRGVAENTTTAFEWYKKAAEHGETSSQRILGSWYHNGTNVEQNDTIALEWYMMAAEAGDGEAMNMVARFYDEGWGVEENNREAFKWYKKGAEADCAAAYYNLGICYHNGEGTTRSVSMARQMMREAANRGHEDAQDYIDEYLD
ncbi:MAG: hypothetical protein E7088_04315 [Bacteroidales bacterium]|nr:hypothetical protein [Bacteroidales bacterium]